MSNLKSSSALPGFRATASLDEAKIHYQMIGKQVPVSKANMSIIPQLRLLDPTVCTMIGDEIVCYSDEPGGGDTGTPGGMGRSLCMSGDGTKKCPCPGNCYSTYYTCYCTK